MSLRPIYFDTETTGIRTDRDRIIEIAAFDPVLNVTFETFVDPEILIPEDSTRISGITNEMVVGAPKIQEALNSFIEFCSGAVVLIAHNGESFDVPLLINEMRRAHLVIPSHWIFIDSLRWARKYRRDLPRHALQYLRQVFQLPENGAHRALSDVKMLYDIFSALVDDLSWEIIVDKVGPISLKQQTVSTPAQKQMEFTVG